MKLLLDQNLSHHLVKALEGDFPGSTHVRHLALERADDATIWEIAKREGYTIVSKDADFHQLSFVHGHPPKVVWLRVGNYSTNQILKTLQEHLASLRRLDGDSEASLLVLP